MRSRPTAVPSGTHNFYFEKDGYHRGQIEQVAIEAGTAKTLDDIKLVVSTGAEGFIVINDGASHSFSKTVKLTIGAGEDAVLMKISENPNFTNTSWVPVSSSYDYTFSHAEGYWDLFVKFADANGLESSPFSNTIQLAPILTNSEILFENITNNSIKIKWKKATGLSASEAFQYKIVKDGTSPLDSVEQMENSPGEWITGEEKIVTDLSPDTLHNFTILVKDSKGNMSAYPTRREFTLPN